MLHALKASLNLDDSFEACVWAMASCAYWGMMRFGEVSVQSRASFDGAKHLKQLYVCFDKDLNGKCYARLDLPSAKTAVTGEIQSIFLVEQQGLCPLEALENLARVVLAGPNDPPVFMDGQERQHSSNGQRHSLGENQLDHHVLWMGNHVWALIQNWWCILLLGTRGQPQNC